MVSDAGRKPAPRGAVVRLHLNANWNKPMAGSRAAAFLEFFAGAAGAGIVAADFGRGDVRGGFGLLGLLGFGGTSVGGIKWNWWNYGGFLNAKCKM